VEKKKNKVTKRTNTYLGLGARDKTSLGPVLSGEYADKENAGRFVEAGIGDGGARSQGHLAAKKAGAKKKEHDKRSGRAGKKLNRPI